MGLKSNIVIIRQLDTKFRHMEPCFKTSVPQDGWIKLIRNTLNMSLRQLGAKMKITPQSVKDIERREKEGTITLNSLRDAAAALDMKFTYCLIPNDGSLEQMIERKAYKMATEIVKRTSMSMKLESQENSEDRINEAIKELANEIKHELPKKLWE